MESKREPISGGMGKMLVMVKELVRTAREGYITLAETQKAVHRAYIVDALEEYNGNQGKAARALGVHRNTVSRLVGEWDIDVREIRNQKKPAAGVGVRPVQVVRKA